MFDTAASVNHRWKIYIVQNKCCIALFSPLNGCLRLFGMFLSISSFAVCKIKK